MTDANKSAPDADVFETRISMSRFGVSTMVLYLTEAGLLAKVMAGEKPAQTVANHGTVLTARQAKAQGFVWPAHLEYVK